MTKKIYNVSQSNCEESFIHKFIEYEYNTASPMEGLSVILFIHRSIPVIAYLKDDIWYDPWNDTRLDIDENDIISFAEIPINKFYKPRKS